MRIVLDFYGETPSVKNRYRAIVNKKGKAQIVKDRKLSGKLNYLIDQIDRSLWDLKLVHPKITMQRFCPLANFNQDRDGVWTGVQDLLVRVGLLAQDDDLHNNGLWTFLPTQVADAMRLEIILETEE